jgi:hypothetical protein
MAFDLVHYFTEQIQFQKPELLAGYPAEQRKSYLTEINVLTLGKLIDLWRKNDTTVYQEIHHQDALYIQEIVRHLTTSKHNHSTLPKAELEVAMTDIFSLQLQEIKQLDETGQFGQKGIRELLLGQVEHLSGRAEDWVWTTNNLTELLGSKPIVQEAVSLDATMKEFNQMVHQSHDHHDDHVQVEEPTVAVVPTWAKVLEPIVAVLILWVLYCALSQVLA